ncbi:MAG: alanine racemase [Flavobacteriaceae bacterium]
MRMAPETVLEIDLKALGHNYGFLRSKLRKETLFMAVVKAFAYGSDAVVLAKRLVDLGADYLAVAYTSEGVILREAGIKLPILVLHPQPHNFKALIEWHLEPSLYSPRILTLFLEAAQKKQQRDFPVHIKFNTGLNRLGFWENDVDFILDKVRAQSVVRISSLFSHLAASDDVHEEQFTRRQINTFSKIVAEVEPQLDYRVLKHLLNTSGIVNYPDAQWDMVRSGIGLHGYGNHPETDAQLKPVGTLKTVISQIHRIEPGESVGYNRAYTSDAFKSVATLPIGHADGIGRLYGNGKGFVSIAGRKAPIIGNVCMDMLMVDITEVDCKEGDEVIVFGKGVSAEQLAANVGTISYELITGISQRVRRKILNVPSPVLRKEN